MAVSRSMWERGLRVDHLRMARNFRSERDAELSQLENIRRNNIKVFESGHKEDVLKVNEAYHEKMRDNDTWLKEQLAMGPPK